MERRHAIIVIRNSNGEVLQYYDKVWDCYLFLNCKVMGMDDNEAIKKTVKDFLKTEVTTIDYKFDRVHSKYSVKDKIIKEYHHYFYLVDIDKQEDVEKQKEFVVNDIKFKWFSYEELMQDERIKTINADIVGFVKEMLEKY